MTLFFLVFFPLETADGPNRPPDWTPPARLLQHNEAATAHARWRARACKQLGFPLETTKAGRVTASAATTVLATAHAHVRTDARRDGGRERARQRREEEEEEEEVKEEEEEEEEEAT